VDVFILPGLFSINLKLSQILDPNFVMILKKDQIYIIYNLKKKKKKKLKEKGEPTFTLKVMVILHTEPFFLFQTATTVKLFLYPT